MSLEHSKYYRGSTFLANIMSAKEYKMVQMSQLFRDKKCHKNRFATLKEEVFVSCLRALVSLGWVQVSRK